jgi:hypothetical protein
MRRHVAVVLALIVGAALIHPVASIQASPVCAEPPREICGGRIFAEAENSISFVQHDNNEYADGLEALEEEFPRFVKVRTFSQILGKETLSAGGREILMIEITDFQAPEKDKEPVFVSLSVHGPERAGLEGGVRYAEDLARWAADEPDHELRNGTENDSTAMPVSEVLRDVHLYMSNLNPDGWAAGDIANGGAFVRGNDNGYDLNRQFPTKGWTKASYEPLSQPETNAWVKLVKADRPTTASDLHGELNSANNAYADIMYPAGQWNPKEQAQTERLARHMSSNVARYFEEGGIDAGDLTGNAGMIPAEYATAYDVVGYDDSGFMGDFFTEQAGAVEVDVEHFLSHMVPNSTWAAPHEAAHIAAVRGEIETLIVEAMVTKDVKVSLDLGKTGYLFDPRRIRSRDGYGGPKPPKGVDPDPYNVSRMAYFTDLSRFSKQPLRKIESGELTSSSLDGLDTFVIGGRTFPRDPDGKKPRKKRIVKALKGFVRSGGNLVLTDAGLKMLPRLGVVDRAAIARSVHNAGHVNIEDFEDRYLSDVHTTASQTYYAVPIGYSVDEDAAPHFTVARGAWEEAGGKSIAYVTDEERIGLGRVDFGKGTIGIFGALLPDPTEIYDHWFGLADYAVTVAGGQILNNMIGN